MRFESVAVVGMHFRGAEAKDYAAALQPGDILQIEPEPDNPYDSYALKVLSSQGLHIGYIEREMAALITPQIEEGMKLLAFVEGLEQRGKNLHPIVTVFEDEGESSFVYLEGNDD